MNGARVYRLDTHRILVKQTVQTLQGRYVIDEQRERHVNLDNDAAIAQAIRDALAGELPLPQ
jgi:hypothetical protein